MSTVRANLMVGKGWKDMAEIALSSDARSFAILRHTENTLGATFNVSSWTDNAAGNATFIHTNALRQLYGILFSSGWPSTSWMGCYAINHLDSLLSSSCAHRENNVDVDAVEISMARYGSLA